MADQYYVQLKKALLEALDDTMKSHGFRYRAKTDSYWRRKDNVVDIFQLVWRDAKPGWSIDPNLAIRFDAVEDIFHQTSGFQRKFQGDTPTVGNSVGALVESGGDTFEYTLSAERDILPIAAALTRILSDIALPYYDKFHTLAAVDSELNDRPTERTPQRVFPWLRCATGLIVARLVERPNYDELVKTYTSTMQNTDDGFYLSRFLSLVKSLESIA